METIIRVQNVGKKYVLRHHSGEGRSYVALRDVLAQKAAALFRRNSGPNPTREDFWALKDISFEIKRGEAVGIIGRNGAGKSTLLKVLSRIVRPTKGRIEIAGRVASLLEVGTGFHPELTGRENIFLNGAIMGMAREEIRRKFDEIVAFAEVERFLDTPVKHFSSGMYVRLAFAVAAHLDPEVLIVDEVLAVGDMQFQKKCLNKMEDVTGKEGRTVLFVSHNMDLITKLCSKAILLTGGEVTSTGPVEEVARHYVEQANVLQTVFRAKKADRALRYAIIDTDALKEERLVVRVGYRFPRKLPDPVFALVVYTEGGTAVTASTTRFHPLRVDSGNLLEGEVVVEFEPLPLWPDRYTISFWLNDGWIVLDYEESALNFEFLSRHAPMKTQSVRELGAMHIPAVWTVVGPLKE